MMFRLGSFNLINEFERAFNESNAEQLGSVTALHGIREKLPDTI